MLLRFVLSFSVTSETLLTLVYFSAIQRHSRHQVLKLHEIPLRVGADVERFLLARRLGCALQLSVCALVARYLFALRFSPGSYSVISWRTDVPFEHYDMSLLTVYDYLSYFLTLVGAIHCAPLLDQEKFQSFDPGCRRTPGCIAKPLTFPCQVC